MNLALKNSNVVDIIESFSKYLEASLKNGLGWARLTVNNEKAKGTITAIENFPNMGAITFNITFNENFIFQLTNDATKPMYFIFCLEGHLEHKFHRESRYSDINNHQNVIFKGELSNENKIKIPKGVHLKISLISIKEENSIKFKNYDENALQSYIDELFSDIEDLKPYRYLGKTRPKTGEYVKLLIENKKEGIVGRLLTESCIKSILASQIDYHDIEGVDEELSPKLTQTEIKKVLELSKYIAENLSKAVKIEELKEVSGLNSRKLQIGFKYLYGITVNSYVIKMRLEKARDLIENSDLTISEIVYSCGLNNRSYFTQSFKKRFGILPSDYRLKYKK